LTWGWGAPGDDGGTADPTLAIGEACRMEHSFWVEQVYFNQPQALESEREQLEQFRDPLVQRLADHGVTVDPDADIYDIIQKAVDLASVNDFTGPDCNDEVGVAVSL